MCPRAAPGYWEHMGESDSGTEDRRRIEVNWVQSMAGAFAAVTSAVLLSTVGVAGTVIGAAIGSVVATVGGAVYSYYIAVTKDRVARAHAVAATRVVRAQSKLNEATQRLAVDRPQADEQIAGAGEDLEQAKVELEEAEEAPDRIDWRTMLAGLPWKRIALGCLCDLRRRDAGDPDLRADHRPGGLVVHRRQRQPPAHVDPRDRWSRWWAGHAGADDGPGPDAEPGRDLAVLRHGDPDAVGDAFVDPVADVHRVAAAAGGGARRGAHHDGSDAHLDPHDF